MIPHRIIVLDLNNACFEQHNALFTTTDSSFNNVIVNQDNAVKIIIGTHEYFAHEFGVHAYVEWSAAFCRGQLDRTHEWMWAWVYAGEHLRLGIAF